jgi:hypothetical protein
MVAIISVLTFIVVIVASIYVGILITSLYIKSIPVLIKYTLKIIFFFKVSEQGRYQRKYSNPKINPTTVLQNQHESLNNISNITKIITDVSNTPINHFFSEIPIRDNGQNKDSEGSSQNNSRNSKSLVPVNHVKSIIERLTTKCKRNLVCGTIYIWLVYSLPSLSPISKPCNLQIQKKVTSVPLYFYQIKKEGLKSPPLIIYKTLAVMMQ